MNKELLEIVFEAASIQRWNDHIRPNKGFTELDKQGHKMYYAFILGRLEEMDQRRDIHWTELIEGGIFEFLHRIVVTDIKPPIFYKLMEKKREELNQWVIQELEERITDFPDGFMDRMVAYLDRPEDTFLEKRILKAAHFLATNWEFKFIYHMSSGLFGLDETKKRIEDELEEYYNIAGVQNLVLNKKTSNFLDLVGQLRFQQRWAQSPRIPETSVMGHMLVVALMAYLCSVQIDACPQRIANNFFGGLLHDLPEVLTRDIVSPVKKAVKGLDMLIKDIESSQLDEQIFPLLPKELHSQIRYYTENEFQSKIIMDGNVQITTSRDISEKFNEDIYQPLDGEILKGCDQLAAYLEAAISLQHGIRSYHIQNAFETLKEANSDLFISGIDFGKIYRNFSVRQ